MYVKEITEETLFLKPMGTYKEKQMYFVEEKEINGILTCLTTRYPLKAKVFTTEDVYKLTIQDLGAEEIQGIIEAHKKKDTYRGLSRIVSQNYMPIKVTYLDYGYQKDIEHEIILLKKLDAYEIFIPIPVVEPIPIDEEEAPQ